MSILKNNLKKSFTQIPNDLITDKQISQGARLVAIYLFSKPDGWVVNNKDVQKQLGISKPHTIAKYWKELISSGWVKRKERRSEGKFNGGFDYEICRNAQNGQTGSTEMPINGNAENGQMPKMGIHSNTDINNNTEDKTLLRFKEFWNLFPTTRKGSEENVLKAYVKAVKRSTEEEILAGLREYVQSESVANGFAKGAAAWLNDDGWNYQLPKSNKLSPEITMKGKRFSEMTEPEKAAYKRKYANNGMV